MKGSEVGKAFCAGNLQKTVAQHQVQAPELAQAAQNYSGEALNRLFAQQAQEAAQKGVLLAKGRIYTLSLPAVLYQKG